MNRPSPIKKYTPIVIIWIATALIVQFTASAIGPLGFNNIAVATSVFIILVQWLFFIPAYLLKTEVFYDTIGSLSFIVASLIALYLSDHITTASLASILLINLWACRLGCFLFWRIHKRKGDARFDNLKRDPLAFFIAWNLQALWIITSLAPTIYLVGKAETSISALHVFGLMVAIFGLGYEAIADEQKRRFTPSDAMPFMRTGLWAYSQYPNYLGEILFWSGLTVVASSAMTGLDHLLWLSPIFIYLLLTKVSGIPLASKRAEKKHADNPLWQDYTENTPLLLPRFWRKR